MKLPEHQVFRIAVDKRMVAVWRHQARLRSNRCWLIGEKTTFVRPAMLDHPTASGPRIVMQTWKEQAGWELWTDTESLELWPDQPVGIADIAGVDTTAQCITIKTDASILAEVYRRPLTDDEFSMVQQERLIESNNAVVARLSAAHQQSDKPDPPAPPPPEINETILWHFQQKIVDELDTKLKSAPSASVVFTLYCRDRLALAEMVRRHKWPYRTLKARKAALEACLHRHFNLTLAAFFVDRSMFRAAERQLTDHHAQSISPQALGGAGHANEEA